jgi:hypothetical protein
LDIRPFARETDSATIQPYGIKEKIKET